MPAASAMTVATLLGLRRARAARIEAGPEDYRQRLRALGPGDVLRLLPGDYRRGLPLHGLAGRADAPIVIEGPEDERSPARFLARPGHNTVSLVDASHVVVRNLALEGRGLRVDAVKAEGHARFAHHVTLERLRIAGHGANQQVVGISTKCPAWGWVVRGNVILGAGTGMYFGDSDGSAPFVDALIEHNFVADTLGYNLQIKHQNRWPALAGLALAGADTVIRRNVFSKARGANRELPRPNVLVGHPPPEGPGRDNRHLVYGNFFYRNPIERLFQGEGRVALYGNLFVQVEESEALVLRPHKGVLREGWVFHNTVVSGRAGVRVVPHPRTREVQAIGNAVFAAEPIVVERSPEAIDVPVVLAGNVTGARALAARLLEDPEAPPGAGLSLYPRPGALGGEPVARELMGRFPEADRDFDGGRRTGVFRGAYVGDRGRRGWSPALERMPPLRVE